MIAEAHPWSPGRCRGLRYLSSHAKNPRAKLDGEKCVTDIEHQVTLAATTRRLPWGSSGVQALQEGVLRG